MEKASRAHGRLNIVKMAVVSKCINRLNAISIKISDDFFAEVGKMILKIHMKMQGTQSC